MNDKRYKKLLLRYGGALDEEYGMGGAIGSALGAVAGSVVPGVGTMVGSSVGGALGSGVDALASKGNRKEKPAPYRYSGSSYGNSFRKGGSAKNVKGGAKEFVGPSHEQGGIDLGGGQEVEGGETMDQIELKKGGKVTKGGQPYIFSKTLNVPGSNLSFAKYHKQLKKRNADDDEIRKLAMQQEKTAGRINKTSRHGGTMKKYRGGGKLSMKQGTGPYQMMKGYRWYKNGGSLSKKKYQNGGTPDYTEKQLLDISGPGYGQSIEEAAGGYEGKGKGSGLGTLAAQFGPDLVNLATGLFGKDKTEEPVQVDKSSVRNFPTSYNVNPLLSRNAASYRAMLSDPNASGTQKLAAQSQKMQADSQAMAQKQNQENQLRARKAGLESNLDAQQAGMDAQARQDRMASQANLGLSGNFARQSLSSIASKILQMNKDQKMSKRDKELMKMIIEGYGANQSHTNYLNNLSN